VFLMTGAAGATPVVVPFAGFPGAVIQPCVPEGLLSKHSFKTVDQKWRSSVHTTFGGVGPGGIVTVLGGGTQLTSGNCSGRESLMLAPMTVLGAQAFLSSSSMTSASCL
jgi:hypothetical protein